MNDSDLLRYSRQIMLPDFDVAGQERLLASHVLIVGIGGLGSPAAMYLAASGIGRLTLADDDVVDLSNLQRQIAHGEATVGRSKVQSAAERVAALNSTVAVCPVERRLEGNSLTAAVEEADLVLDATDNMATRVAINEACVATRTPLVSGAAIRMEGQVAVFDSRNAESPCYRCLYDDVGDEALNCAENGVIAPLVGIVGTVQAMEAVKLIAGVGEPLVGHVLYLDAKRMEWRKFRLPRNPRCPTCGTRG
ncbi:MAG: molybdopterin-synthase adenylyltransferase MoeB [Gammaproteobacteria bacterium]|nr:molybdopterin-synthase adenylyltransferase MoeB [Gammaproteobacteria bacterium]